MPVFITLTKAFDQSAGDKTSGDGKIDVNIDHITTIERIENSSQNNGPYTEIKFNNSAAHQWQYISVTETREDIKELIRKETSPQYGTP